MAKVLRADSIRTGLPFACGLLVFWLLASPAGAQWMPNGVPLCTAYGGQGQSRIASDGAGGAIVVWSDERDYASSGYDFYAQRVMADGMLAPGWQADGVPVCTDSAFQGENDLIPDGDGGGYVVWSDARAYATAGWDIFVQRLTAEGAIAPGWTVNGIRICAAIGDQRFPKLALDGAGGTFAVWEDYRRGGDQVDIYAQRITPEGKIAPGWPVDGLPVCVAPGLRTEIRVMPDGLGGLFIEWADGRSVASSGFDVYALRLTAAGEVAPGWVADGVPICTAPNHQGLLARLVPDGQDGFISAWADARTAPPGTGNVDPYIDTYAQRMTGLKV